MCRRHEAPSILISLPKANPCPQEIALSRQTASHAESLDSCIFPNGIKCPSSLSCPCFVLGTTPRPQTNSPLPCRDFAVLFLIFPDQELPSYLRHTPMLRRFNHPDDIRGTGNHSGNHSTSQVSTNLCKYAHVARWCYPSGFWLVCSRLPPGHSRSWLMPRLSGDRNQKLPLIHQPKRSLFGTVFIFAYQQAVTRLS